MYKGKGESSYDMYRERVLNQRHVGEVVFVIVVGLVTIVSRIKKFFRCSGEGILTGECFIENMNWIRRGNMKKE